MSEIFGFDLGKKWDYENGFYLTSDVARFGKIIAHYELYKKIIDLPGQVLEFGVYKASSFIRFCSFRELLESQYSRKIIGFDAFGKFPRDNENLSSDMDFIDGFEQSGGDGISKKQLEQILENKHILNIELVQGNILETLPKYLEEHPELRVSLLHIDVDVYHPTKQILSLLYDRIVKNGLMLFDDYGTVAGETVAVEEFIKEKGLEIKKLPMSHIPSYIIK